ncbi:MAG: hypothetical protein HOE90_05980 [Bacteriovoracaceae bacterium]|jgi:hypothetical protein|nr:hypothetical protein [Bacteriovoracaceae bacterium]
MKILILCMGLLMTVNVFADGDRDEAIGKRGNGNDDLEGPKEIRSTGTGGGGVKTRSTGDV